MTIKSTAITNLGLASNVLRDENTGEIKALYKDGELVTLTQSEEEAVIQEVARLEAEALANNYKVQRLNEYLQKTPYDQLEMMADGTFDAWYAGIKAKYPKPR